MAKLLPAALKHLDHLHDILGKKARQEGEGRGVEVLRVTFSLSLSPPLSSVQYGHGLRAAREFELPQLFETSFCTF
jgi:hypothetical protein